MTTEEFISELCGAAGMEFDGVFERGRKEGWLEAGDVLFKDRPIKRRDAARILHMYLLKVMKTEDLDINGAKELHDLYDCRICANHIAQVYLRGIMDAKDIKRGGGFLIFDPDGEDSDYANTDFIRRLISLTADR